MEFQREHLIVGVILVVIGAFLGTLIGISLIIIGIIVAISSIL
ncbi:hypothetical protein [Methanobacterium sp. ACI-7]